eukprot:m.58371 g.58371  ORF g.58371 m.58371 type:complete len:52 (-) comp15646_c0_seq1:139-294(-)
MWSEWPTNPLFQNYIQVLGNTIGKMIPFASQNGGVFDAQSATHMKRPCETF